MMHRNDQEYIRLQRRKLIDDEKMLRFVSRKYSEAKAAFDADCAARGIDWNQNPVAYMQAKSERIQLDYWYSKVEHFQREVTARASLIVAFEAAHRITNPQRADRDLR